MLRELAAAGPLELTLIDGLIDPGWSWSQRDEAMARRVLVARAAGTSTLVVAGNAHTPVHPTPLGVPLGAVLAAHRPGVREIRIEYRSGGYYNLASRRFRPRTGSRPLSRRSFSATKTSPSPSPSPPPAKRWCRTAAGRWPSPDRRERRGGSYA